MIAVLTCMAFVSFPSYSQDVAAVVGGDRVYVGGFPIGISLDVGGVLVDGVTGVDTEYGNAKVEGFKKGDIIKKINGKDVTSADDVSRALCGESVNVEFLREGKLRSVDVKPLVEAYSGKHKLGIRIKDKIFGIGTVTFVRADGRYAALGHEIYDSDTDTHIPFCAGKIYGCKILGLKKGSKGEAGALLGSITEGAERGTIECNNRFGIAGEFGEQPTGEPVEVADRYEVRPGPAVIRTTVDNVPQSFDIEIIKASKRAGRHEKCLVFRVTDKKLLGLTGGVVRGMSGSPILQNGKLVGAVTHVFLNDFTKGYGIYADCLN